MEADGGWFKAGDSCELLLPEVVVVADEVHGFGPDVEFVEPFGGEGEFVAAGWGSGPGFGVVVEGADDGLLHDPAAGFFVVAH